MKSTTLCLTLAGLLATSAAFAQTAPADPAAPPAATSSSPAKTGKQTTTHHKKVAHKKVHKASTSGS
ncbi:MAG: hypothetical protein E7H60_06620 [Pseudomonas oryzihabitans]|uniref:Acid-shock protein n=1 Tax=Pseudomonas oryzihabitans TaxID=47885 RepID=A0ABX3IX37_9PSED|nr:MULTISPECIES: hypothetical protein [Pseudomonas]KTT53744.1 hypothetical protein NS337_12640 [Pseudomonas psychrotolerans]MBA1259166.1 hypothetical protein [Pseudomonas psychrotolerans]MDU4056204.1 hypothetical protein [Pseudomonas oryzihabitans]NMZ65641.1 hypothetical protein [Pseudomonas oryzihabitans]ONN72939.1 hypothetical protein BVL52_03920 [Pseudomonas psychrotolerans]